MGKQQISTLTLCDALRLSAPVSCQVKIKTSGPSSNLGCHYCHYLNKAVLYGCCEPRMTEHILGRVIYEYIHAHNVDQVWFHWHGGEPLLLGLDFYRKAIELEQKYADGKIIHNTIQTNGILLNKDWAEFFSQNGFLVGISIDGPEEIHDQYRIDKGGAPNISKVLSGLSILRSGCVEFYTISTINHRSEGRGLEVYLFLKSLGSHYMQFMPVVEHVAQPLCGTRPRIVEPSAQNAEIAPWSVDSLAFGQFLIDIFDYWVRHDVGHYFVNIFEATLSNWCGVTPGACAYTHTCGGNTVVEHNGDLYPCDHFVYPQYRLGNILTDNLPSMMASTTAVRFGKSKRDKLSAKCLSCDYLFACQGECPKHRFCYTDKGDIGVSALCDGSLMYFEHIAPYMALLGASLKAQLS